MTPSPPLLQVPFPLFYIIALFPPPSPIPPLSYTPTLSPHSLIHPPPHRAPSHPPPAPLLTPPLFPQEHAILDMVWGRCNEGLFSPPNTTGSSSSSGSNNSSSSSSRKSLGSASASASASGSKNSKLAPASSLSKGFGMFFTQTILVPPNRFRPAAKIGDNPCRIY